MCLGLDAIWEMLIDLLVEPTMYGTYTGPQQIQGILNGGHQENRRRDRHDDGFPHFGSLPRYDLRSSNPGVDRGPIIRYETVAAARTRQSW